MTSTARSLFEDQTRGFSVDPVAAADCVRLWGRGGAGVVYMTDEHLRAYCAQQAEDKLPFIARMLARMPSHEERQGWLDQCARKQSPALAQRIREMAWEEMKREAAA